MCSFTLKCRMFDQWMINVDYCRSIMEARVDFLNLFTHLKFIEPIFLEIKNNNNCNISFDP